MKYKLKNQINTIANILNKEIVERESVIRLSILGTFVRESVFLLGPPGIGKSLISRKLTSVFKNAKEFSVLMNKFTLTDEIFGPVDINELKEGRFKRKTKGYLPDSNIAFLDEIWKSSSSIQNTLLTILNEKIFVNDGQPTYVDLQFVIAASNELPERNQSLEALWDRFLLKFNIKPIVSNKNFIQMVSNRVDILKTKTIPEDEKISFETIDLVNKEFSTVELSNEIINFILDLKAEIEKQNDIVLKQNPFADGFDQYYVSDRKWKKIVNLLQASAYLNERNAVDFSDLHVLNFTLWNNLDQLEVYKKMIHDLIYKYMYEKNYHLNYNWLLDLRALLISLTTKKTIDEKVSNEIVRNIHGEEFYLFFDNNKTRYYFAKNELDSISVNENLSVDWLISYLNEEEFNRGETPNNKILVHYENFSYSIYEDNNEEKPRINLFSNFQKVFVDRYELVEIDPNNLHKWISELDNFKLKVNTEISFLEEKAEAIKNKVDTNIFWDQDAYEAELSSIHKAQEHLKKLIEKANWLDKQKDKLKFGYSISNIDILFKIELEK